MRFLAWLILVVSILGVLGSIVSDKSEPLDRLIGVLYYLLVTLFCAFYLSGK